MKKINQIIALLFVTLVLPVLSSASPMTSKSPYTGNKIVKIQSRPVTSFHAIKVSGGIDVELSQGNELKLQVEADENLLALIKTEVKDGILSIYHDENIENAKTMKVHLTFKTLDAITASGGCDISSKQKLNFSTLRTELSGGCDLKLECSANVLACNHTGGSDAELSGVAQNCTFNLSGGCDVKASDFHVKNCTIDASGGSDVSVYVTGELIAKAEGASDITYYGKPAKITKSAHGASDIQGK